MPEQFVWYDVTADSALAPGVREFYEKLFSGPIERDENSGPYEE